MSQQSSQEQENKEDEYEMCEQCHHMSSFVAECVYCKCHYCIPYCGAWCTGCRKQICKNCAEELNSFFSCQKHIFECNVCRGYICCGGCIFFDAIGNSIQICQHCFENERSFMSDDEMNIHIVVDKDNKTWAEKKQQQLERNEKWLSKELKHKIFQNK